MKKSFSGSKLLLFALAGTACLYFSSCSKQASTPASLATADDQYLQSVVQNGTGDMDDEANLMLNAQTDLDDGGAVANNDDGLARTIDSLRKWGRKIEKVTTTITISNEGDSIKTLHVVKTFAGTYLISEYTDSGNHLIKKPYKEVLKRDVSFKRIDTTNNPLKNWKLYQISMIDGQSIHPQGGHDYVQINKIEVWVNNILEYTFTGPNFTHNFFTTHYFGGDGVLAFHTGDIVHIKVYTFSKQSEPDIVAWHWAANTFGFHREPFTMLSQSPHGAYWDRIYEKEFKVYNKHPKGWFNGFINASTYKSLYDDSPVEFASDLIGAPYKVQ